MLPGFLCRIGGTDGCLVLALRGQDVSVVPRQGEVAMPRPDRLERALRDAEPHSRGSDEDGLVEAGRLAFVHPVGAHERWALLLAERDSGAGPDRRLLELLAMLVETCLSGVLSEEQPRFSAVADTHEPNRGRAAPKSAARTTFEDLLGNDRAFVECIEMARRAAMSDMPLLITGETGSGKEMLAQAIHNASRRQARGFVGINVAAIPRELLESELFGYDRGAFTGARSGGKPGLFELAGDGTLLLDEIGDMRSSCR